MLTSRKSRFFDFFKRRSRRETLGSKTSSEEFHSLPATPTSPIHPTTPPRLITPTTPVDVESEDQRDGFYKYGESFEENPLSLLLPPYQVPEDSSRDERDSDYFNMAPRKRHSRPYTVSSDEWVGLTSASSPSSSISRTGVVFSMHDLTEVQRAAHFGAVLKIFIKIFTMAKILHVAFLAYGVHLDHSETGLLFWIKRAEAEIRTDSLGTLIEVVENLFYVLYSRIVLELANIELSSLFKITTRPRTTGHEFTLPAPDHLYRIFIAFKDILDAPSMCEAIRDDLVTYYQESSIQRISDKDTIKDGVFDDILGFRRYAVSVVSDKNSAYSIKWNSLIPCFDNISPNVIAILAEKYLTVFPKLLLEDDIPLSELPFAYHHVVDPTVWNRERTLDHRTATLAKLQGRVVGEERRDDHRLRLLTLAKQEKCICTSICSCALGCTDDVERPCPCSERQLRIMLARRRKDTVISDFMTRANTLGRAFFEALAVLKPDTKARDLTAQVRFTFENFQLEIQKERDSVSAPVWH